MNQITVFWDLTLYNLVDRYKVFESTCCLQLQGEDYSEVKI